MAIRADEIDCVFSKPRGQCVLCEPEGDKRKTEPLAQGGQFRRGYELRSQVWRSAKEKPNFGVCTKSQLGLASRAAVKFSGSYPLAIATSAIPLGKTTPGC